MFVLLCSVLRTVLGKGIAPPRYSLTGETTVRVVFNGIISADWSFSASPHSFFPNHRRNCQNCSLISTINIYYRWVPAFMSSKVQFTIMHNNKLQQVLRVQRLRVLHLVWSHSITWQMASNLYLAKFPHWTDLCTSILLILRCSWFVVEFIYIVLFFFFTFHGVKIQKKHNK